MPCKIILMSDEEDFADRTFRIHLESLTDCFIFYEVCRRVCNKFEVNNKIVIFFNEKKIITKSVRLEEFNIRLVFFTRKMLWCAILLLCAFLTF